VNHSPFLRVPAKTPREDVDKWAKVVKQSGAKLD